MDVTKRILFHNECEANIFAGKLVLVTCVLSLIFVTTILLMDTFIDHQLMFALVLFGNVIRLSLYRHISVNKGQGASLKWLIVIYALIFAATISILIGEMIYVMFAFPILIMARYNNYKKVITTSIITISWIWIFSFLMIPIGIVTQTFSLYHIAFASPVTITIQPGLLGLFDAIATAYPHLDYTTICSSIISLNFLYTIIFGALTFIAAYIAKSGKKNIDTEIRFVQKDAEQKSKELDIINTIADSIECFYFVDPVSGSYEFKAKNSNSEIVATAQRLAKGENFFENLKENIHKLIFFEDRELCRNFFSKENLAAVLESGEMVSVEFRWIMPEGIAWTQCKAIVTTDINGNKRAVISVEDISHTKEAIERNAVLAGLGNDMDFICYANISTGIVNVVHQTPIFEELLKKNNEQSSFGSSQVEKFRTFLKDITILEDLPKNMDFFNAQSLLRNLADNKFITFNMRIKIHDRYMWYLVKCSHDPSNPNAFVLGLLNIDNQVKTQFKLGEFSAYEKMRIFTEAFSESFVAAFYINLQTNNMQVFKQNTNFEELYGVQKNYKSFINLFIENILEEDREQVQQALLPGNIKSLLQKKPLFSITMRTILNGNLKWIRVDVVQAKDKDHAALAFKDITPELEEKQQKEQSLEIIDILSESYSELHYFNLVDSTEINLTSKEYTPDSVAVKPQKNTSLLSTFKKLIEEETHPDDREMLKQALDIEEIKKNLAHQKRYNIIFKRKYGSAYKYTEMTIAKPETPNKEPQGIAIGFVEVDNSYRAELEQQANINRVMNLAEDFEFIYDVDIDSGEYTESARNKENIKFLTPGISFDKNFYISVTANIPLLVYQDDQEMMQQALSKDSLLSRLEKESNFELNYRSIVGQKVIWYKMKIVRSGDWNKEHRMLVGIFNNEATHQREAEYRKQLQYALTLAQSANHAKTAFLNNMSHDIRTPMNAIIGFSSLATKHIDNKELVEDYLSKIGQSSDHLLSLINNVLDMSSIESGKMVICEKEENLNSIMQALESIIQVDVDTKHQQLTVDCSSVHNPNVICDKLHLSQIILNLITNSIKYTPENGEISIVINERTSAKPGFRTYEFRIKDNGIGMSEETQKNAYDPFFRAQSTTVCGIQGTGLGLTITKSIVEMMNGQIQMSSKENEGTETVLTFDFKLHDQEVNDCINQESDPDLTKLKGKRILLVEDNKLNREICSTILEEEGFNVDVAENGEEAVQKVKDSMSNEYDVILMDIQMPVLNGYGSTKQIRAMQTEYTSRIPIIALTANAFEEDRNAALNAGMNEHLSKPISIPSLKKMLHKYLH